jgi:hypothetical protein
MFPVPKVTRASSFVFPPPLLCDECGDNGLCPVIEEVEGGRQPLIDAEAITQALGEHARMHLGGLGPLKASSSGAINPCAFRDLHGELSVVYRATTATRCGCASVDGEYDVDQPTRGFWSSRIGLCDLRLPTNCPTCPLVVAGCTMIDDITAVENLDEDAVIDGKFYFGAEDPRAFVYQACLSFTHPLPPNMHACAYTTYALVYSDAHK